MERSWTLRLTPWRLALAIAAVYAMVAHAMLMGASGHAFAGGAESQICRPGAPTGDTPAFPGEAPELAGFSCVCPAQCAGATCCPGPAAATAVSFAAGDRFTPPATEAPPPSSVRGLLAQARAPPVLPRNT